MGNDESLKGTFKGSLDIDIAQRNMSDFCVSHECKLVNIEAIKKFPFFTIVDNVGWKEKESWSQFLSKQDITRRHQLLLLCRNGVFHISLFYDFRRVRQCSQNDVVSDLKVHSLEIPHRVSLFIREE